MSLITLTLSNDIVNGGLHEAKNALGLVDNKTGKTFLKDVGLYEAKNVLAVLGDDKAGKTFLKKSFLDMTRT